MQKFKAYTAYELIKPLQKNHVKTLLDQFAFYKKDHKDHPSYQIWEEGFHLQGKG